MSDRDHAIEVLKQARDRLARQLMDRVLEAPDEILDEADGISYGGRIETIYEQFGSRLANVSSMLGQLQMLEEEAEDTATASTSYNASAPLDEYDSPATVADTLASAGPMSDDAVLGLEDDGTQDVHLPATWEGFVEQVRQKNRPAAVRMLAELFELDTARAEKCVAKFAELCGDDPGMFARAELMRPRLRAASMNDALGMLWRLFELQGPEAIGVFQVFRVNIERQPSEAEPSE